MVGILAEAIGLKSIHRDSRRADKAVDRGGREGRVRLLLSRPVLVGKKSQLSWGGGGEREAWSLSYDRHSVS